MSSLNNVTSPFRSTAQYPRWTTKQSRMLTALADPLYYYELLDVLLEIAREEYNKNSALAKSMSIVIKDLSPGGPRDIEDLLMALHKDLVTSIVKNDIGHKIAVKDPEINLEHLLYETINAPGSYLVTVVVKNRSRGLSANQWKEVRRIMMIYLSFHEYKLPSDASAERIAEFTTALDIQCYLTPKPARFTVSRSLKKGIISNWFTNSAIFLDVMKERFEHNFDPSGNEMQLQMPCQVGCGVSMKSRMNAHDYRNMGARSSKCLDLFLACLTHLKIQVDMVLIPVVKIWHIAGYDRVPKDVSQFEKAEILVTMLAGSLVWDGGFKVDQAGTNRILPHHMNHSMETKRELIEGKPWFEKNVLWHREEYDRVCLAATRRRVQDKVTKLLSALELEATNIAQLNEKIKRYNISLLDLEKQLIKKREIMKLELEFMEMYIEVRKQGTDWPTHIHFDGHDLVIGDGKEQEGWAEACEELLDQITRSKEVPDSQEDMEDSQRSIVGMSMGLEAQGAIVEEDPGTVVTEDEGSGVTEAPRTVVPDGPRTVVLLSSDDDDELLYGINPATGLRWGTRRDERGNVVANGRYRF